MVNDTTQIVVNCNEMIRGSLEGGWAQQVSQYKYSLASVENGGVQVRELTTKAEVFDTIRVMSNVGWTENALRALDGWMRIGERWNKRSFRGSGGFAVERIVDNHLLGSSEDFEMEKGSEVRVSGDSSDSADANDLAQLLQ